MQWENINVKVYVAWAFRREFRGKKEQSLDLENSRQREQQKQRDVGVRFFGGKKNPCLKKCKK